MKKLLFVAISVLTCLSFAACSDSNEQATSGESTATEAAEVEPSEAPKKIILAATGVQQDQFTNVLIKGYESKAEELGIELLVANSQLSMDKESEMINNFIEAGAQGIIIEPVNPDASAAMAELAASKGIPVFACAIPINSDKIFASSINDNTTLGSTTGKASVAFLEEQYGKEEQINTAVLSYDTADPVGSGERIDGFKNEVLDYNMNYVARQDVNTDNAYAVVTDILTANPDLDVIFCASENGLVGAYNAVKAAGKSGEVFVFGIDCSAQICDMMLEDTNIIQATTAQAPFEQGQYAVQTMYDYIVDGIEPEVQHMTFDGILISQDNPEGIKEFKANWEERSK